VIGIFVRRPGPRFLTFTLGFSAGVMILVSFVELLATGIEEIGFFWGLVAFFGGMGLMFLIDVLIPHSYKAEEHHPGGKPNKSNLHRTGMLVALGIGIHNLPEGLAAFAGALENVNLGIAIAVAIAIHNIPEGLAVSAPIYAATGSRKKAFWFSFLSGVAEPVGAGIAAIFLMPFLSPALIGTVLAAVGGIMFFISIDELVPASKEYGFDHLAIIGIIIGMVVMAASLWILKVV
ncbi:zinc transporter ZupT, partial [candidate division WOR-3 bacterium]|nr:zinc transporter ZupT [candidate division WOR-3 bacterium]MBD3365399.1 zinc transporter ZupT [candidate division WOR-3 bacterium]